MRQYTERKSNARQAGECLPMQTASHNNKVIIIITMIITSPVTIVVTKIFWSKCFLALLLH